jgi:hypothetical protein
MVSPCFVFKRGNMNYQPEVTQATEEAEDSLIGAILVQSSAGQMEAIRDVKQFLEPWDFRGCLPNDKPERWVWRGRIYYAMTLLDIPPNEINVALKMEQLGILQDKDCSLLCHCVWLCPCSLDYLYYAKAVKEYSMKRQAKYYADKGDLKGLNKVMSKSHYKGLQI